MPSKYLNYYFIILFSLIPFSFLVGPAFSLSNVILIDISFLIYLIYQKDFVFFKNNTLKYFLIFYIYLIFNSVISIEPQEGILRNLGFLRIVILFITFNYFFYDSKFTKRVLSIWLLTLLIVIFDVYLESISGKNILGYGGKFGGAGGSRIVSFFKEEPIVGAYLFGFYLLIIGFLLNHFENKYKLLIFIFSLFFLIAILITGERSNGIKALLGIILFLLFYKGFNIRVKIGIFVSFFLIIFLIIFNSNFLKIRFLYQLKTYLNTDNVYFNLYKSGYQVFKNNPIVGVGNKNYRIETCRENTEKSIKNNNYICQTHPHQIYFEILSEHGLVGLLVIFYLLYKLIFSKIRKSLKGNNYIQIGSLIYLLLIFLPVVPSGSFFGDFSLTLFLINIGIFYGSSSKLNLFNYKNLS